MTKKKEEEKITKKEQIEETLENLDQAIEHEAEVELQQIAQASIDEEGPITLFLKGRNIEKEINNLKDLTQTGLTKTSKNVIVFYKQAYKVGERARGFVFMAIGLSMILAGLYATTENLFSLKEVIILLDQRLGGLLGRLLMAVFGISLVAYGLERMMTGLWEKILPKKKVKEKYRQKRLTE